MATSIVTLPDGWVTNSTFNPYNQTFAIVAPDGVTTLPASMASLLDMVYIAVQQGVIFGIQIGATALLLIILLLMTKQDKRRSAVFALNLLALLFCFTRSVLIASNLHGIFYNFYNWQLHYYPDGKDLRTSQNVSAASDVFNILITAATYGSLILQIWIVCCNVSRRLKIIVLGASGIIGLIALGVRVFLVVFNIRYSILGIKSITLEENAYITYLARVNNIVNTVAIAIFSAIFLAKLAIAIHMRRKLNMKQFGPMQIIFVMGCQTLFLPLIFATIAFYTPLGYQINSFVPVVVAISLPLSGMWATAQTDRAKLVRSRAAAGHRAIPVGATDLSSAKAYGSTKSSGMDTADTLIADYSSYDVERDGELYQDSGSDRLAGSPSKGSAEASATVVGGRADGGVEMEQLKHGVVVDRTYSVRSD
ncbi:hypothetical protein KC332_g3627 [Hortaea werneckii]|uniref:Pheromone alpha factor receptor n=2 Tax=Hortaea werneckii TaxID=91943 RepID=A0A3M7JCC9_HORWE|nr:hypothetical protein KC358_g15358 [Hortaea werneckii]OTA35261.1 hypothetical protein BTJ68_04376 [Hortaea werneckii EXF-2000]KAI6813060.1 hypothetical protein KC350_g11688 [Hortaea werneckii]KAI6956261.1 hypothetical protein KC321_g15268 [Hortaea werneckii]KAI6991715.1 hypothetical protein KC329_g4016 [Hortaea werneckii]